AQLTDMHYRFEHAVIDIMAHRLNTEKISPLIYDHDIAPSQKRWMSFLRKQEEALPGISGTARYLYASLLFGFARTTATSEKPKGFNNYTDGVEALAQFLVERMAAMRNDLLWSAREVRRKRIQSSLLNKLSDGPQDTRTLVRRFHSLPARECNELLIELEESGDAVLSRGKWELPERRIPQT
ncbi:MAG TPA: hypothetical protein V6D20_15210, partial [Candidatus Obscuribacterales bacterium]